MDVKKCKITDLKVHPYNETKVPYISSPQLQTLKEDIEKNGLLYPLIVQKGTNLIIDGKNRFQACHELGFEEIYYMEKEFEDEVELKWFILTRAAKNRNLSTGQRAAFAALTVLEMRKELGIEGSGRPKKFPKIGEFFKGDVVRHVAREWHVSHSYVQLALNVKKVSDEFFQAMLEGEKTPSDASEFLAKLKLNESADNLISEIKELVEQGKLTEEAAWYLSQLTQDEQKVLLEMLGKEGVSQMDSEGTRKVQVLIKKSRSDEEFQKLKEELLELRKERETLFYRLQSSRDTIEAYEAELANLKESLNETVRGHDPEAAARIQFLEEELESLKQERDQLTEQMEELESQKEELNDKFVAAQNERDEVDRKLKILVRAVKKDLKRQRRRGRKRKSFYMRHIEDLERENKKLKDLNLALKDQANMMRSLMLKLERKCDFAIERVEAVQALNQLNAMLGILNSHAVKCLPYDIAERRKNGPQAMEMLSQIGEMMLDLMERVTIEAHRVVDDVHKELANYPTTKHLYKNGKRIVN